MFKSEFGNRAVRRVDAIMGFVDEMYSEKDTLKTEFDVSIVAIEHAQGKNWGLDYWGSNFAPWTRDREPPQEPTKPEYDLSKIANDSPHDANIYVFLTGSDSKDGLGRAKIGSVCDTSRDKRLNINQYSSGVSWPFKGGDAYTAEV